MKVIIAKKAGFCMGVRRAVDTTLDLVRQEEGSIATFGPLIHNPQVLELFSERGVKILDSVEAVHKSNPGTIIIRAHGIPPAQYEEIQTTGARVTDATCPRVVKVQAIIKKYQRQGYATVIIGDRNHAEVEGLMGFAEPRAYVVSREEEVERLNLSGRYIIVSQTTQDETSFEAISRLILARFPEGLLFNTICDSTHKRQKEVRELCRQVDAMVVVGGKSSANTKRLAEIAGHGCPVFLVETDEELDIKTLSEYNCVGVTAGASTPAWMINRVARALESIPGRSEGVIRPLVYRLIWLVLATNLYVSIGGGFLAYSCGFLQNIRTGWVHFIIAFGYLFAMHNINRLTDLKAKRFNDPAMAAFRGRYRWPLLLLSAACLTGSLVVTYALGREPFVLLIVMSVLGMLYSERFIPKVVSSLIKVRGLYEIPGSKTLLVAMAWAVVVVLIPAMGAGRVDFRTVTVLLFVMLLVFVRNGLFDIFEVQGDRIVGKETLPVCIGVRKTMQVIYLIMGLLILLALAFTACTGLTLALWLIPGMICLILLTRSYEHGRLSQGPRLEFGVESVFVVLAGLLWVGSRM